jgi:mannose-6-phosphate isomerase-like protein (cupin superfamily)
MKKGFFIDIEEAAETNKDYRRVLYTSNYMQLVLMTLQPGEEIGEEVHGLDQFICVQEGVATVTMNRKKYVLEDDMVVVIPAGVKHNVENKGEEVVKLYTVYSPPEHKDKTIHKKKKDESEEHFDGKTTE